LLRPQFLKSQVSDLGIYEKHFQILLEQLPEDGEPVEFADLFLRYTMDVATESLFGRGTMSLKNPEEKFARAFSEVQRMQSMRLRYGYDPVTLILKQI